MEKTDARTLTQDVQESQRLQIVLLREAGRSNKETAEIAGKNQTHCSTVWQRYKKQGPESLVKGKRGRRHGEQRDLTPEQEAEIKKLMIDKAPNQLKLAYALWTRDAVKLQIQQRLKYEMPIRTVGEYLKRWGFIPQKPVKCAKEQSTPAVARWLLTVYPAIAARAKQEKVNPDSAHIDDWIDGIKRAVLPDLDLFSHSIGND